MISSRQTYKEVREGRTTLIRYLEDIKQRAKETDIIIEW